MNDSELAPAWPLRGDVAYLNHGSFGACPRAVLERQAELRARLEAEPYRFLARELEPLLDAAREELARFVGADPEGLAFVPNATHGVNTVLRSVELERGDELLTTDHAYNACRNALDHVAARSGARVVVAAVPFPLQRPEQVVGAVLERVTPRTRLALLDHVTSPTGLVFPVQELVAELRARGVDALVDGAHAPGMLELELDRLGAAYYTGNAHKWLCAPKGAAFLHVRADKRAALRPLSISHGFNADRPTRSRFRLEFDWTGTDDPTPWLCIPEAIRVVGSLVAGGWAEVRARNRALALAARDLLCAALHVPVPCPDEMIGSLASVPLPRLPAGSELARLDFDPLTDLVFERHRIETWFYKWPAPGGKVVRASAQLYNTREQFARLAAVLRDMGGTAANAGPG
ncbi:MAG: aminotransferase class V-fold PLP-dependent enzyme [Acidobacteria bacterium]|nr:aminotransferase class V-fold PLP-dependent enzyme [Acidobacteriota bacterium]